MFTLLNLLLLLGAVLRVTRLINEDSIVEPVRRKLPRGVRGFTDCPWCVSFWVALGLTAASWQWHGEIWFRAGLLVLGLSWLTGIAAQWLDAPPPPRILRLTHVNEPPPSKPAE